MGSPKLTMGQVTLTMSSLGYLFSYRLVLATINMCTKFEDS